MSESIDNIKNVISVIHEIVKDTTIFNETIYDNENETSFDSLSIKDTLDKYIENLKNIDLTNPDVKKYTIKSKLEESKYKSIELFYKDFVIVCFILLNTLNKYSESYYTIDKLYQVVSELVLRNLSSSINNSINNESYQKEDPNLIIPKALKKGFETQFNCIAEFYQIPIKKQLQVNVQLGKNTIDRNGANKYNTFNNNSETLFSSILNKSILDKREDQLPDENVNFINVLPVDISSTIEAPKLGLILASTNKRIPDPTLPATRILTKYINPLWYKLPVNIWLKNLIPDDNNNKLQHILPIVSKNESLINNCKATDLWMKKTNYLVKYNQKEEEIKQEQAKIESLEQQEIDKITSNVLIKKHASLDVENDNKDKNKINLKNLVTWSELHYYTDEELDLLTKCDSLKKVQEFISKYLSKLIVLQQQRLKNVKLTKPKPLEIELYHKIQNLLKIVLIYSSKEQMKYLELPTINTVPILQPNYTGSLSANKLSINQTGLNFNNSTSPSYTTSGKYRSKKYRKA
ncbi:hypothetical protein ACO0SA_000858 [Hanseniaspora valbyensis]